MDDTNINLSATYIPQVGGSRVGITGFKIVDVIRSFSEFRDKKCVYCGQPSAAIECAQSDCKRRYHYICGYRNYCVTQFCGQFLSYCHLHLPAELERPINISIRECDICFSDLPLVTDPDFNPVSIVRSCGIDGCEGLMHRECVQRFAYTSGYNFKCPLCFDKTFNKLVARFGIFVPQRESAWEREAGAFKDLHKRKCTAEKCLVMAKGTLNERKEQKNIVGCKICGGQLMHRICVGLQDANEYLCSACKDESFVRLV
uniref:PHD-type domain-containing protein n=1 Tax=Anopheles farauti TaxID=69004 RepID=A0A182QZ61_9DIPT